MIIPFPTAIYHLTGIIAMLLLFSCSSDPGTNHETALPHNLEQSGNFSQQDASQLASAKGKTASLLSSIALHKIISEDTATLFIVNFWKIDCQPCFAIQQHLQTIQTGAGTNKLNILSISLDEEKNREQVNLQLRREGIITAVSQLLQENPGWMKTFSNEWKGELPAFFIKTSDGFRQFYQQEFSENELKAFLQPFLL
jgi:thiol-disulfide isomerase/thioredoxin